MRTVNFSYPFSIPNANMVRMVQARLFGLDSCAYHKSESECLSDPMCTWFDLRTMVFPIPRPPPGCISAWDRDAIDRRQLEFFWGAESAARNRAYWRDHNTHWLQTNNHTNDTNHTSPPPPEPIPPRPEPVPVPAPVPIPSPTPIPAPEPSPAPEPEPAPESRGSRFAKWTWIRTSILSVLLFGWKP